MDSTRKLAWPDSPVTKLKILWRNSLNEFERDYWRDRFAGPTSNRQIRQELTDKYGLTLLYDTQLVRFRHWLDEYELRAEQIEAEAEAVAAQTAELQAQGLTDEQLRHALLNRMKTRALVLGDFDLACRAINLELRVERHLLHQRKFELEERRALAREKQQARAAQPGGITPEVLAKIERELNLL